METGFDLSQDMRSWVSPSLIEANHILSLSRQELQTAVQAEMDANPALELEDLPSCPVCGNVLDGSFCPICLVSQRDRGEPERYEDMPELLVNLSQTREDSDDFDPLTLIAHGDNIRDVILRDARTVLSPDEYPIAEYLVDSIDERGLPHVRLVRIGGTYRADDRGDRGDRRGDPRRRPGRGGCPLVAGVAAPPDCLPRAIRRRVPPQVAAIVGRHLGELGAHRFGQIGKELGLTPDEVEEARAFIRSYLNPFPLQSQQARSWRTPSGAHYVAPDVIISLKDDELIVEIIDTSHFHLRLSPVYDKLAGELGRKRSVSANGTRHGHSNGTGNRPLERSRDRKWRDAGDSSRRGLGGGPRPHPQL
jgi:RNA polymerase sigma-54 factor